MQQSTQLYWETEMIARKYFGVWVTILINKLKTNEGNFVLTPGSTTLKKQVKKRMMIPFYLNTFHLIGLVPTLFRSLAWWIGSKFWEDCSYFILRIHIYLCMGGPSNCVEMKMLSSACGDGCRARGDGCRACGDGCRACGDGCRAVDWVSGNVPYRPWAGRDRRNISFLNRCSNANQKSWLESRDSGFT